MICVCPKRRLWYRRRAKQSGKPKKAEMSLESKEYCEGRLIESKKEVLEEEQ